MRRLLTMVTATVLVAVAYGAATAPVAYAKPKDAVVSGDVTGVRGDGTGRATFTATGSPSQASGSFTFTDSGGATFTGTVTCLYREKKRAVLTGPITGGSGGGDAFVLWVQDSKPDAFDAATTSIEAARQCQTNFPLNRFDEQPSEDYYVVTSGNIVIGE